MGVKGKIVIAAINFLCLLVTLIYPNDATPIALLPCWITAGEWLYLRIPTPLKVSNKRDFFVITFFVMLVVCATLSMFVGFGCTYIDSTSPLFNGKYLGPYYSLKENAVFPFNFEIEYAIFEGFVCLIFVLYFICEIIISAYDELHPEGDTKNNITKKPSEIINNHI